MNSIISKPFLLSVLLHALTLSMLLVNLDLSPTTPRPVSYQELTIDAVTVNNEQVEQEIEKIKAQEQQKLADENSKKQALEQQLKELQKKTNETEEKRKTEEKRLVDLKKRQQDEEKLRKVEEKKLAEAKNQQEVLKKQREEEEKKRQLADEKKKQEELRLAEEDKKRKIAEEALKNKLAEEQRQQQEAQAQQDTSIINSYLGRIKGAITLEFNKVGLPPGLSCIILIRMIPGGDVVQVSIDKSSGNALFDSRAETAVKRASPLPVHDNPRIFDKMRDLRLTFNPN